MYNNYIECFFIYVQNIPWEVPEINELLFLNAHRKRVKKK